MLEVILRDQRQVAWIEFWQGIEFIPKSSLMGLNKSNAHLASHIFLHIYLYLIGPNQLSPGE